ncbi:MAG: hypothetical protein GEU83_12750 [Pseudonocardiaceae bacterium]|nr:hypothetical protein [Pseudonocardiaceae bacterium]
MTVVNAGQVPSKRGTPWVKRIRPVPLNIVTGGGPGLVSHAGGALLTETARRSGLAGQLSRLLGPWRRPLAIHDPGKIVCDLAVAVALGGDAATDVGVLRAQPGVFGPMASDPTASRLNHRAGWPPTCSPGAPRLALPGNAARWEPKRLRLRILAVAGRIVRTGRRRMLNIPEH